MDNVKVLKLTTGEEIVSEIVDEGSYYKLKNPVKFVMTPIGQDKVGIEMHPFIMLSRDTEYELSKEVVMLVADPLENVENSYKEQFGTIVTPPNNIIT